MRLAVCTAFILAAISPAAAQTSPRELVEMTDFSGLAVSPDGRWLLYRLQRPSIVTGQIDTSWHLVATDGRSKPIMVGDGGRAVWNGTGIVEPGAAAWSPGSDRFYVRALVDGAVGIWVGRTDGTGLRPLIVRDSDVERFGVAEDGALVYELGSSRAAVARAEEEERANGILVDGRVDLAQTLFRGSIIAGRPASQRLNGDWFDREPLLARTTRQIFRHHEAEPVDRPATTDEAALLTPAPAPFPEAAHRDIGGDAQRFGLEFRCDEPIEQADIG